MNCELTLMLFNKFGKKHISFLYVSAMAVRVFCQKLHFETTYKVWQNQFWPQCQIPINSKEPFRYDFLCRYNLSWRGLLE